MDKDQNRKSFPFAAHVVDEFRALGVDVKVTFAEENGRRIGKPMDLDALGFVPLTPYDKPAPAGAKRRHKDDLIR